MQRCSSTTLGLLHNCLTNPIAQPTCPPTNRRAVVDDVAAQVLHEAAGAAQAAGARGAGAGQGRAIGAVHHVRDPSLQQGLNL